MPAPLAALDIRRDLVGLLPKLRRFAVTLTGDLAEADELVQNVCHRGITKIHLWNNEGRLESWLYTIARQQLADEARRHKQRVAAAKAMAAEHREPAMHAQTSSVEANEGHQTVISLPEGLGSVFLLVDIEHHSYKQAADILGIPLSTVASRLVSARQHLAAIGDSRSLRKF
jgi:RNA polymerase sigma-70 factor (ECF subfamily)